jgi:hypothetical protein
MPRSFHRSLVLCLGALALLGMLWTGCSETPEQVTAPAPKIDALAGRGQALNEFNPRVQAVIDVQNKHTPDLLSVPDVVGTGTGLGDDGQVAVLVLTRSQAVNHRVPASLDGVPTQIRVVGEVTPMAYKGTYRPVPGGVSVGNDRECASGTVGCIVLKGGVRYVLSNNHVLARMNAGANGERIDQPGRYDGKPVCAQTGAIGALAGKVNINFSGGNNTVDCAIASLSVASTCAMASGYTPSTTTVSPSVGLAVKKTGRTSGLTHGTIAGINVTIQVNYGSPGVATFVNQIYVASNFIRSGDSGSLMVTESGNNPVGLCFAGGSGASFANPIGPVLQGLGVSVCGQ